MSISYEASVGYGLIVDEGWISDKKLDKWGGIPEYLVHLFANVKHGENLTYITAGNAFYPGNFHWAVVTNARVLRQFDWAPFGTSVTTRDVKALNEVGAKLKKVELFDEPLSWLLGMTVG